MIQTKILAVEDERIVALHLRQQLTSLGYNVVAVAASGERALAEMKAQRPDLVLMDIHIEGAIDGIETAALIPAELRIPVIYLTAYSEEATLERARATKPYGYLLKPFSERELHATIQMALERRTVETALEVSDARFRSIFGAIAEGIIIVDSETGLVTEVNDAGCQMFGYAEDELIGHDIRSLWTDEPPYTAAQVAEWIESAAVTGEAQTFDWRCLSKDGQRFWAEISLSLAAIGGQNVVLSIVRDLTERKAIEEQLRQAQKMEAIGQLTGGIAHDFNNLLGVIIGNLDLLRGARPDDVELEELSGEALNAALGGADLTRRLLAFARRQPLQSQGIDLRALVAGTMKLLRRVVGEDIEISVHYDDDLCWVHADTAQLEAALTNLVTNARDAMPSGGKLLISTGLRYLDADYAAVHSEVTPGEYALLEVTDTGEGMPQAVINHIFEPFYTTKNRDRGTGLGLSMVFGFLKQSGGHVSVYSEPGVGSTFRLYLPRATPAQSVDAVAAAPEVTPSRGETILVVEDNSPLRRIAVRQLRELGYRVLQAKNTSAALTQLQTTPVDLLFTDVVMPGELDGLGLARLAAERWPDMKVVLTSGFPKARMSREISTGSIRLLSKPYRRSDLARVLREVLDATPDNGAQTEGD
jgi:PAS domain S-box-containing protein